MEDLNLYEDEHDVRLKKVKKRKLKRKYRRLLILLIIVILFIAYLISGYSKVKHVKVINNNIYTQSEILDTAGINLGSYILLNPNFIMNYKLSKLELIESISIQNDYVGNIVIEVNEKKIIGFIESDINLIYFDDGTTLEINDDIRNKIRIYPLFVDFKDEKIKEIVPYFENIDKETLYLISEIKPYSTSYDKNMLELIMQDGNKIRTSINGLSLLDARYVDDNKIEPYQKILEKVKGNHVCIMLDEGNNVAYTEECNS